MAGILLPAEPMLARYFPGAAAIGALPGGADPNHAKVLLVEGDLVIDRTDLIATSEIIQEATAALGDGETLVAIVITGDLQRPTPCWWSPAPTGRRAFGSAATCG